MFNYFKRKHNLLSTPPPPQEPQLIRDFKLHPHYRNIRKHLFTASRMLKIELPVILSADYIANYEEDGQMMRHVLDTIGVNDVPASAQYDGAHSLPNENRILLGMYDPYTKRELSEDEQLFLLLHELRHFWQYIHRSDIYYSTPNATTDLTHLDDISEIDADAFALVFMRTQTQYIETDYFPMFSSMFACDNGKRLLRATELLNTEFATVSHSGGKL